MKKHKTKIIAAVIILATLAGTWFFGGNYSKQDNPAVPALAQTAESLSSSDNAALLEENSGKEDSVESAAVPSTKADAELSEPVSKAEDAKEQSFTALTSPDVSESPESTETHEMLSLPGASVLPEDEPTETAVSTIDTQPHESTETTEVSAPLEILSSSSEMEIDPETGKDRYQTSQVPEGMPAPVEPQDMTAGDGSFTITLTVRCDTILNNMNLLNKEKHELVPADGVIFPVTSVTAYEGESVFNILQREMRRARIHMVFRNTPIYNSAYIEAINNLYEFDVGELSGWGYSVNGWFPNYGCSRYQLQPGDTVEWHYTCDLGRDLGQDWDVRGYQSDE